VHKGHNKTLELH